MHIYMFTCHIYDIYIYIYVSINIKYTFICICNWMELCIQCPWNLSASVFCDFDFIHASMMKTLSQECLSWCPIQRGP